TPALLDHGHRCLSLLFAVDDSDRRHHSFVLVFKDVAMKHKTAKLRSFESKPHKYAGARREGIGVVQELPIHGRYESAVAEALDGGWASFSSAEISVEDHEFRLVNVKVVTFIAVVHEQPVLPRAVGRGEVGGAVHPERRVELG